MESLFAIVLGVVITLGVILYYQSTANTAKMAVTIKLVNSISDAVRTYAQAPNFEPGAINLTTLEAGGLLTQVETVNPWDHTTQTLKVSTNGNYLGISFANVPLAADSDGKTPSGICASLASQLSASLPFPSPGTVTLNGVTYTISPTSNRVNVYNDPKKPPVASSNGAAICQVGDTSGTLAVLMDLT